MMSLLVIPFATGRPPRPGSRWWVQVGAHIPFVSIPHDVLRPRLLLLIVVALERPELATWTTDQREVMTRPDRGSPPP